MLKSAEMNLRIDVNLISIYRATINCTPLDEICLSLHGYELFALLFVFNNLPNYKMTQTQLKLDIIWSCALSMISSDVLCLFQSLTSFLDQFPYSDRKLLKIIP